MEEEKRKSWFGRNWLWFVPSMGCLTLIVLAVFGIIGVFSLFTDAETTRFGLEQASKNPQVVELLGEPIEDYGIPSGNMSYSTSNGNQVDMTIPIRGPKGEGSLKIKGYERDGTWIYETLIVTVKGTHDRFNLLEKPLE